MERIPVFVGLDYHTSAVQACVMNEQGEVLYNRSCANDWKHIVQRVERVGAVKRVAIESCSGAAELAEELTQEAGWIVDLAHPGYVARMKQSPDKTDYADAHVLADLQRVGYLPKVWLAPRYVRELRLLVRYRQQLVNQRRAAKLRVSAVMREQRIGVGSAGRWSKAWLGRLKTRSALSEQARWVVNRHLIGLIRLGKEIQAAERQLRKFTQEDRLVEKLMSMPGIGAVTAWFIRAEVGRFDRFASGKQLSRFCGLSPRNVSSGTRQADAGLVKAANRHLRAVLIEAAHRLIRFDPRWNQMGNALRSRGKPGSLVAAAVANRWIRWLFHQMVAQPA